MKTPHISFYDSVEHHSKNADKKLYPASLTKLMTALLLYENTEDLDAEILTVSKNSRHFYNTRPCDIISPF